MVASCDAVPTKMNSLVRFRPLPPKIQKICDLPTPWFDFGDFNILTFSGPIEGCGQADANWSARFKSGDFRNCLRNDLERLDTNYYLNLSDKKAGKVTPTSGLAYNNGYLVQGRDEFKHANPSFPVFFASVCPRCERYGPRTVKIFANERTVPVHEKGLHTFKTVIADPSRPRYIGRVHGRCDTCQSHLNGLTNAIYQVESRARIVALDRLAATAEHLYDLDREFTDEEERLFDTGRTLYSRGLSIDDIFVAQASLDEIIVKLMAPVAQDVLEHDTCKSGFSIADQPFVGSYTPSECELYWALRVFDQQEFPDMFRDRDQDFDYRPHSVITFEQEWFYSIPWLAWNRMNLSSFFTPPTPAVPVPCLTAPVSSPVTFPLITPQFGSGIDLVLDIYTRVATRPNDYLYHYALRSKSSFFHVQPEKSHISQQPLRQDYVSPLLLASHDLQHVLNRDPTDEERAIRINGKNDHGICFHALDVMLSGLLSRNIDAILKTRNSRPWFNPNSVPRPRPYINQVNHHNLTLPWSRCKRCDTGRKCEKDKGELRKFSQPGGHHLRERESFMPAWNGSDLLIAIIADDGGKTLLMDRFPTLFRYRVGKNYVQCWNDIPMQSKVLVLSPNDYADYLEACGAPHKVIFMGAYFIPGQAGYHFVPSVCQYTWIKQSGGTYYSDHRQFMLEAAACADAWLKVKSRPHARSLQCFCGAETGEFECTILDIADRKCENGHSYSIEIKTAGSCSQAGRNVLMKGVRPIGRYNMALTIHKIQKETKYQAMTPLPNAPRYRDGPFEACDRLYDIEFIDRQLVLVACLPAPKVGEPFRWAYCCSNRGADREHVVGETKDHYFLSRTGPAGEAVTWVSKDHDNWTAPTKQAGAGWVHELTVGHPHGLISGPFDPAPMAQQRVMLQHQDNHYWPTPTKCCSEAGKWNMIAFKKQFCRYHFWEKFDQAYKEDGLGRTIQLFEPHTAHLCTGCRFHSESRWNSFNGQSEKLPGKSMAYPTNKKHRSPSSNEVWWVDLPEPPEYVCPVLRAEAHAMSKVKFDGRVAIGKGYKDQLVIGAHWPKVSSAKARLLALAVAPKGQLVVIGNPDDKAAGLKVRIPADGEVISCHKWHRPGCDALVAMNAQIDLEHLLRFLTAYGDVYGADDHYLHKYVPFVTVTGKLGNRDDIYSGPDWPLTTAKEINREFFAGDGTPATSLIPVSSCLQSRVIEKGQCRTALPDGKRESPGWLHSFVDRLKNYEKPRLPLMGIDQHPRPPSSVYHQEELDEEERKWRGPQFADNLHSLSLDVNLSQFGEYDLKVVESRLLRAAAEFTRVVGRSQHIFVTAESRKILPPSDLPHILPPNVAAVCFVPEGSGVQVPGFTSIEITPISSRPRELAFWRLLPLVFLDTPSVRYYIVNSGRRPAIGYETPTIPVGFDNEDAIITNFNSDLPCMAGTLITKGNVLKAKSAEYIQAFKGPARLYGFDEWFLCEHLTRAVVHMTSTSPIRTRFRSHAWKLTNGKFFITDTSAPCHQHADRIAPVTFARSDVQSLDDRELFYYYEANEPTLQRYIETCDEARRRVMTIPKAPFFSGLGWRMEQGCAFFELEHSYRGTETSIFRHAGNASEIHWSKFFTRLPFMVTPPHICELIAKIEEVAAKFDGKVAISACPDGPPPPAALGWGPIAINGSVDGWVNVPVAVRHGRENAFLRLAVMMTGPIVKEWWILNGREVELQLEPSLVPGRLNTANRYDTAPLVLYSTRSDLKFAPGFQFGTWFEMAFSYGLDETVLKYFPISVEVLSQPTPGSCKFFPLGQGWPDVEIRLARKVIFSGRLNRLTVQQLFQQKSVVPKVPSHPTLLNFSEDKAIRAIEANMKDAPVVTDVLSEFEGKEETILFVAYGTRGDIQPVQYLANVAYSLGIRCAFYVHAEVSSEELREIIAGNFYKQIKHAFGLFGLGRTGFKGYVSPQLRIGENSLSFELTPWEYTSQVVTPSYFATWLLNFFIATKLPDFKIGTVHGSNVPRAVSKTTMLRVALQGKREKKIGWVTGSDGPAAVPAFVREECSQITDTDHNGSAFIGYTHVWCNGGQGIMQTLRAKSVIPLVYAPGFDRTLNLPCEPGFLKECNLVHFVEGLKSLGAHVPAAPTYSSRIKSLRARVSFWPWLSITRTLLMLWLASTYIQILAANLTSFPALLQLSRTSFMKVPYAIAYLIWRYPLLFTVGGFWPTVFVIIAGEIFTYASKVRLAKSHGTYLAVQVQRKFPWVQHMKIVDTKRQEQCHMSFQGKRINLRNPFRGVIERFEGFSPNDYHVPVPINYPALARHLLVKADRYSPWFNCQVVMPSATDYDLIVTCIVATAQIVNFPLTFIGYMSFLLARSFKVSWANVPAADASFYRFGTQAEYDQLAKDLEAREQERLDSLRKVQELNGKSMNLSSMHPSVHARVILGEYPYLDGFIPATQAQQIEWNPDFDKDTKVKTLLQEAIEELQDNPDAYTLDSFVLHAAILAEGAIEQGMPEDFAYHGSVLALHDFILAVPPPPEVDAWRKKFVPIKTAGYNLDRWLQSLSNFISAEGSQLPNGLRTFLMALYRWVEGVGAKIKTYAVQIYRAIAYIGDGIARVNIKAWEKFSELIMPLFDQLFGGKLGKRIKTVWALSGVNKNPMMSNQKRLQEMYAFASYERHEGFNESYASALEDIVKHLPTEEEATRLFPQSKYKGNLKSGRRLEAGTQEQFSWFANPREQYRPANAPKNPVMGATEAIAAYLERDQSDPEVKAIRNSVSEIMANKDADESVKLSRVHSVVNEFLREHRELAAVHHDAYLTMQVVNRLSSGSKQTVDHMHEVKRHPATMFEMQDRYAYLGLKYDPKEERIPDTFATLDDERKALYDDIARHIVKKWPERYQDRKLTRPEALMNYLEWDRGSGPMFEMSYEERQKATAHMRQNHNTQAYPKDTTKRFRMWESGLGAAVLKKAYEDAKAGHVDVQQFAAFVKSQPTPVNKLARGVTFMPITQWFKGMMECFAQNQRVTWRTTYIGKNMPGGAHMREFFEKVRQHPVVGEGDATQMDSRFEAGILYGLGRIAHHAWTWGSPNVENGAAIASHKAERYKALADGWIFNLHIAQKDGLRPRFHLVNAMNRSYEGSPVEISVNGQSRFFYTRNPQIMEAVRKGVDDFRREGSFTDDDVPDAVKLSQYLDINIDRLLSGARLDPSSHARPQFNNVTQKIRGGATGLEDTTDLNTDGKKIGTIAALVTFGRLIGHPISVSDAMDESKYLEAHTSDDNIFGIDPLRLYNITPEEFHANRDKFMQAFAENNLNMTFLFHEGVQDGVRGRFLEYLSYFSRPLTMQDRRQIQSINAAYRAAGVFGPDKKQNELLDPLSGLPPTDVVYINTKAMDARQTAQNAYKQHSFRDRYLLATIQRDIGQAQLKAWNFQSYCQNLSTYHTNAVRYLAKAAFPDTCSGGKGDIARVPRDKKELEFIEAHFHPMSDTVGKKGTYVRYRIDGNILRKLWPYSDRPIPSEFIARIEELKKTQFPAYTKIVYDSLKPSKTPADKATRIWRKINKDILSADEGIKEIVDDMRRTLEKIPKKFSRGITPTLDMVYPDELWTGSGRCEAAIYLTYEKECLKANTMPTMSGYARLVNQSPYAGCMNAAAAFHKFNTPAGSAELHAHPEWVYRNACVAISMMYAFTWLIEREIVKLPFIGLAWSFMMFYLIDVSKIYAVIGLARWHSTMKADPYISGLMPRDIYIHSKRFSDFLAGFIPIQAFYVLNFVAILDPVSEYLSAFARWLQHMNHFTPMTSTQPGAIQNEWEPVASTLMNEIYNLIGQGRHATVSVKGPTGTGKSTFLAYALMRLNLLERGGRTFLVAPFIVLRDDWSLPTWFAMGNHDTPEHEKSARYQVLKGATVMRPNATMFLATYGHFQSRIEKGELTSKDLVLMDEGHLGGPAQVMVHKLLEKHNIPIIYLSATPAPVKGLDQGPLVDATPIVTQKNQKKVVTYPASTPVITMLQDMLKSTEIDPQLGFSHRDMAQRVIIKVNTYGDIAKTIEGINYLRATDREGIPRVFEFSSNTFRAEKEEREAYCNKGRYIIVATDIIGVGYDIKPPAYAIIDNGLTIQEHQGYLLRPANSTRDQMEQFHGRVGRNSSDRNGLIYCVENAGTGTPAQQYGSGSFYVNEEVCKAIGVPQLRPLPYQGCMRDFNYFDVKPEITGNLRSGLIFTFLAALSGVSPHEMFMFYRRYAEQGFKFPEEYEWLSSRLAASGTHLFEMPAWQVVNTTILQNPFIVCVEDNNIVGREDMPGAMNLSLTGPIYPRAGQWMSFYELSKNKNTVRVKAKITSESEAFEAIRLALEKENEELRERLSRKTHRRKLEDMSIDDMRRDLKDQLKHRSNTAKLAGHHAAIEVSKHIDAIKPAIVENARQKMEAQARDTLWSAGMSAALNGSETIASEEVKQSSRNFIAANSPPKLDLPAMTRHIMGQIGSQVKKDGTLEGTRKQRRAAINSTQRAKWMRMTSEKGWNEDDSRRMWEQGERWICENLEDKDTPVTYRFNPRFDRFDITWKSDIDAKTREERTKESIKAQNEFIVLQKNPPRQRTSGQGLLCGYNALKQAFDHAKVKYNPDKLLQEIKEADGESQFFESGSLVQVAQLYNVHVIITTPGGYASSPTKKMKNVMLHYENAHFENYKWSKDL